MTDSMLPDRSAAPIVLIVDDVPDDLSLLHDTLDQAGYTVLFAMNGESALQRGYATMAIGLDPSTGTVHSVWQTPLARRLVNDHFDAGPAQMPEALLAWLLIESSPDASGCEPRPLQVPRETEGVARQPVITLQQRSGDGELLVMREVSDAAAVDAVVQTLKLTLRKAEVLYRVVKGKFDRDIGDILGSSPATVKKHLERVYVKLGAETRTAAAGIAMARVGQLEAGAGWRVASPRESDFQQQSGAKQMQTVFGAVS